MRRRSRWINPAFSNFPAASFATSSAFGQGEVRVDPQQDRQREQWQKEQDHHNERHEQTQTYDIWVRGYSYRHQAH